MNFKRILAWLTVLLVSGFSVYSFYSNFKETTSISTLATTNLRDTTLYVLAPTPAHLKQVHSFVNTSMERLEQLDTLAVKFSAKNVWKKQHLFPLNTNNEIEEHYLTFTPSSDFIMKKDCELVAVDSHHDTVSLCKTTFRIDENQQLFAKNSNCPPCDSIKNLGTCYLNEKSNITQFTFFTLPANKDTRQPYISFMHPDAEIPINSETRRFYAEDLPTDLPIKLDGKTLVDIHVLDLKCNELMYIEEGEAPTFSASYFQLVQPSMFWSKHISITVLPSAVAANSALAVE